MMNGPATPARPPDGSPEHTPRQLLQQTSADYAHDVEHVVETSDHEDHTFSGIIFVLECPNDEAVDGIFVTSIAVRGELGPVTVWTCPGGAFGETRELPEKWTCAFRGDVRPSYRTPSELPLTTPFRLAPGEQASVYVHSALRSDTGIVYDNQRSRSSQRAVVAAKHLRILPGCAHLSPRPFSGYHPWGAWRARRQFVGAIKYSVRHLLWSPSVHRNFPAPFRNTVRLLLAARLRHDSLLSLLPSEVLFYVIHLCQADALPSSSSSSMASSDRTSAGGFLLGVGGGGAQRHGNKLGGDGGLADRLLALTAWWRDSVAAAAHAPSSASSSATSSSSAGRGGAAADGRRTTNAATTPSQAPAAPREHVPASSSSPPNQLASSNATFLWRSCPIVALLSATPGRLRLLLGTGPTRTAPAAP